MANPISIDINSFDDAISKIEAANTRSNRNNSNFTTEIEKSTVTCLKNYNEAVKNIKKTLEDYFTIVEKDITSARAARDILVELDKNAVK